MKIALAQINPIIGDFKYNLEKVLTYIENANKLGAEIIVFHELGLCGYPPKDLLLKKQFINDNEKYLTILAEKTNLINPEIIVIIGFAEKNNGEGRPLFNSLAVIKSGKILCTRQKSLLPTYDVFDEDRYFESAKNISAVNLSDKIFGLTICEDIWHDSPEWAQPRYHLDPLIKLRKENLDFIINSSASPYFMGKPDLREKVLINCAKKYKTPLIYVNQVGGNDELIFDGNSCVISKEGEVLLKLKSFEEDLQIIEISDLKTPASRSQHFVSNPIQELLSALICGIHDYVKKCGFKKVILGLSGGIDSAIVAVLATYALGKENVLGILMPSRYTSNESVVDAEILAKNLGIEYKTISIEEPFKAFLNLLSPHSLKNKNSHTEENIQARIRGLILMALSNETSGMVLSTGNKSELATGYCTLYGDLCGGLAAISDIPKTIVYKLANYINEKENKELIPKNIITKAPTAELKPNQKDQDTLPPYDELDKILNLYIEEHKPIKEMIKNGIPDETIQKICSMIDSSEYKRKQVAPGLKLTSRAFGYGWRMPVAQRYNEKI